MRLSQRQQVNDLCDRRDELLRAIGSVRTHGFVVVQFLGAGQERIEWLDHHDIIDGIEVVLRNQIAAIEEGLRQRGVDVDSDYGGASVFGSVAAKEPSS